MSENRPISITPHREELHSILAAVHSRAVVQWLEEEASNTIGIDQGKIVTMDSEHYLAMPFGKVNLHDQQLFRDQQIARLLPEPLFGSTSIRLGSLGVPADATAASFKLHQDDPGYEHSIQHLNDELDLPLRSLKLLQVNSSTHTVENSMQIFTELVPPRSTSSQASRLPRAVLQATLDDVRHITDSKYSDSGLLDDVVRLRGHEAAPFLSEAICRRLGEIVVEAETFFDDWPQI